MAFLATFWYTPYGSWLAFLTSKAGRGIETSWVNAAYIEYLFTAGRFQRTRQDLEQGGAGKLNRDLTPICYYYDLALWLSRFYSGLSGLFYAASFLRLWWLAVPLVLVVALFRWKHGYAVPVVTAFTGFAEMALEIVLLLAFQAFRGYVYHEVSLIYAAFMAGTALGGAAMNRLIAHPPDFLPGGRRLLATVQAVMVLYAALLPMILRGIASWLFLDVVFLVLVSLAGMLGGMEFPLAVKLVKGEVGRVAGLIYGADLVGACLGAILASVLFIPVPGIPQTCYAVALLSMAGLALLL